MDIPYFGELINFISTYFVTLLSRCAIMSLPLILTVLLLRKSILKEKVFLKGMMWALLLLTPFFGKLRAYYQVKKLSYPFIMCQELAITSLAFRTLYLCVMFLLLFLMIKDYMGLNKLLKHAEERLICGRKVSVLEVSVSPFAFGLIHPRVAVPRSMMNELSDEELRTVILHELTHIRLGHLWIFMLWEIFAALFWINPCFRFCGGKLREDMEQICDRVTIMESGREPVFYGTLILKVAKLFYNSEVEMPAMFVGEKGIREAKERFVRIREYVPYKRTRVTFLAAFSMAFVIAAVIMINMLSYPDYEILPDITAADALGTVYADNEELEQSGAIMRTDKGLLIDAGKLRSFLPEDFPRDKAVYFYYDMFMKLPGMGGGGLCASIEDVPESGSIEIEPYRRETRDAAAIWLIKRL